MGIEWGCKIPVVAALEIVPSRAQLIRKNFPQTKIFEGDIWKLENQYVAYFKKILKGKRPWLLTLSPPAKECRQTVQVEFPLLSVRENGQKKMSEID